MSDGGPTITITRGRRGDRATEREPCDGVRFGPGPLVSRVAQGARTAWLLGLGTLSATNDVAGQLLSGVLAEGVAWVTAPRERTAKTLEEGARLRDEGVRVVDGAEEEVRKHVSNALRFVGVSPADDVRALREKVDTLAVEVDQLTDTVSESE